MKIFGLVIMTKNKLDEIIHENYFDGMKDGGEIDARSTWTAINPVIHSLKELRNNTWDKERVDNTINWLRDEFEVE